MSRTKLTAAGLLLAIAGSLAAQNYMTPDPHVAQVIKRADFMLSARTPYVSAAELLDALHSNQFQLEIIDVRNEADYNLFHIVDAKRVTRENLQDRAWLASLPSESVKIVVSNGETLARDCWLQLAASEVPHIYILEGGVNGWIKTFAHDAVERSAASLSDDEQLQYEFPAALGARQMGANPSILHMKKANYTAKIKPPKPVAKAAGGCGA